MQSKCTGVDAYMNLPLRFRWRQKANFGDRICKSKLLWNSASNGTSKTLMLFKYYKDVNVWPWHRNSRPWNKKKTCAMAPWLGRNWHQTEVTEMGLLLIGWICLNVSYSIRAIWWRKIGDATYRVSCCVYLCVRSLWLWCILAKLLFIQIFASHCFDQKAIVKCRQWNLLF